MILDDWVAAAWRRHGADPGAVFADLPDGLQLISELRHLPPFAGLVVHVAGEHLGRWDDGIAWVRRLEAHPAFVPGSPEAASVLRSRAVLHRCAGQADLEASALAAGRGAGPEASDRVRVLAVAAAALLGQGQFDRARADFEQAVALAAYGPTPDDPVARALAVTAHNLAVELENRPGLSDDERAFMLRCAFVSRDFWRIAGGWREGERAQYRLARSHLRAGDPAGALVHAAACLDIVGENGLDPGEAFFAHEVLCRARWAGRDPVGARADRDRMVALLERISDPGLRESCVAELRELDALLTAR